MLKSTKKMLVYAVVVGVVITLVTGLIANTPDCVFTACVVGVVYYGYPFAWLARTAAAPPYSPWLIRLVRLILDIVAWTVVVYIILFALSKTKKK